MSESRRVAGHCPMGCGQTLFLGEGGHITCSWIECPNPTIVDEILDDAETCDLVVIGETNYTIAHPLRERATDMSGCPLHQWLATQEAPPVEPGRYRAVPSDEGFVFEAVT